MCFLFHVSCVINQDCVCLCVCVYVLHRPCPRARRALGEHARHGRGWRWPRRNPTASLRSHQAERAPRNTHTHSVNLVKERSSCSWVETTFPMNSLHGSAVQNSAAANTAPALCGGVPRNRRTPSRSRPADPGVWREEGGMIRGEERKRGGDSFMCSTSSSMLASVHPTYLCTVSKFSSSSWVMLYSGSVCRGSLMQSNRRPPWDSATCRSSWNLNKNVFFNCDDN